MGRARNQAATGNIQRRPRSRFGGQIKIDTLLAFIFGLIFLITILFFAVTLVNPTPFQIHTFKTILALASGGVGAVLPGQFEFKHLSFVRAGGALAVFAAVYFAPADIVKPVAQLQEPTESAQPAVDEWLGAVDTGNYVDAWRQADPASAQWFNLDYEGFNEVFTNVRTPLGKVLSRRVVNRGDAKNPPNAPAGLFRSIVYLTRFENAPQCVQEQIVLRATESLTWKVFSHQVFLVPIPCLPEASEEVA